MASRNTSSNARQNVQRSNRDSARWIAGLLLLCVGIFVAAAVFFSYFCWAEDQSVLQKSAEDRELLGSEIENPCGPLGARLGRMLVDNSFGVFGILIPVVLILVGVRIIRQRPLRINQSVLSLLLVMILGSLTLGYLFGARWSLCSSTGWGGAFGNLLASRHPFGDDASIGMLPGAIGSLGTLILLIGGWILTGVFINRNFINKVNEAGNVLMDRSEKIVDTVRHKVAHVRASTETEEDEQLEEDEEEAASPRSAAAGGEERPAAGVGSATGVGSARGAAAADAGSQRGRAASGADLRGVRQSADGAQGAELRGAAQRAGVAPQGDGLRGEERGAVSREDAGRGADLRGGDLRGGYAAERGAREAAAGFGAGSGEIRGTSPAAAAGGWKPEGAAHEIGGTGDTASRDAGVNGSGIVRPEEPNAGMENGTLRQTPAKAAGAEHAGEESPFVELMPDGRPVEPQGGSTLRDMEGSGDFTEVDLSHPGGRVVMGRGGLVELEPAKPRNRPRAAVDPDEPFIEITVGDEETEPHAEAQSAAIPAAGRPVRSYPAEPFEVIDTGSGDAAEVSEPSPAPSVRREMEPFEEHTLGGGEPSTDRVADAARPDGSVERGETAGVAAGTPGAAESGSGWQTGAAYGGGAEVSAADAGRMAQDGGPSVAQTAAGQAAEGVVVTVESREARMVDAGKIPTESYDPLKDLVNYKMPPVSLLEDYISDSEVSDEEIFENKTRIEETLKYFGIPIQRIRATVGPTVTLYEIVQAQGVKISKIQGLQNDIAQSLKAESGIRIIAPIPGRGTIGIEVPNRHKQIVSMFSAIRSLRFQESKAELPVVIGRTIQNENYVFDLTKMPHLLVAGATGQGKSVGLNAIITSLLYRKHPAQLKFVMIDPKMVEFSLYAKIERHFLAKMQSEDEAIVTDPKKAVYTLNALCTEMDIRLELCKKAEVRNISEYNAKFVARRLNPMQGHRYLPYIVVVIDEFADLIMTAKEVEIPVTRLAQKARAIGIHLIIATQRPSVDVITGKIKANFPARIAFRVMQMTDSRTIIDRPGADQLIGRGDMLISKDGELTRIQCALVETKEVERIVDYISRQQGYTEAYALPDYTPDNGEGGGSGGGEESSAPVKYDSLFAEIARDAVSSGQISTSMIQRNYEVGFNRAGRIMMQLERAGIVGRQQGAKPRDILFYDLPSLEAKLQDLGVS